MARLSGLTTGPPVASLLDVDFYKFAMGQFVFRLHSGVRVRYQLLCRTPDVRLADLVLEEVLRDALDAVRSLTFAPAELDYLKGLEPRGLFGDDYLNFLRRLRLPPVELEVREGDFRLEVEATWPEMILWETLMLSVLSELLARAALAGAGAGAREQAEAAGRERLEGKIAALREHPGIRFASFGTRRRFSRSWQFALEERLAGALPDQFTGTSCVASAFQHGLVPVGTIAHEVFMVGAAVGDGSDESIRGSQRRVLDAWWEMYGEPFSLFLTDTWGSEFFFADVGEARARRFRGVRQDSGDPAAFGERAIRWYEDFGVNPRAKSLVFSDGLELADILDLESRFAGRIGVSYGWGTNLTNDCGVPNYSLVVKPVAANGRPLVKLSDNAGKSTGSAAEIRRYREIFGAPAAPRRIPKY
ncbi:MAG: nicotinate phosphoribosyltransferase [Acidobacteria bacterium]|nr:nicotinate phosphoribosyltransferase [Acidobacteriota bacterium]MYF14300.1 nicotinate phosphoribosyltransferase [Acidobacteriota bacterium]MYI96489.1 nicotinate phosphoribosyltransferase [Acidobacteriota bacterium]